MLGSSASDVAGCLFAIDGMLDTFLTVLKQMEVFPLLLVRKEKISAVLAHYHGNDEAVKAGSGREDPICDQRHALATVRDLRKGKISENDLIQRLAKDKRIGLKITFTQDHKTGKLLLVRHIARLIIFLNGSNPGPFVIGCSDIVHQVYSKPDLGLITKSLNGNFCDCQFRILNVHCLFAHFYS